MECDQPLAVGCRHGGGYRVRQRGRRICGVVVSRQGCQRKDGKQPDAAFAERFHRLCLLTGARREEPGEVRRQSRKAGGGATPARSQFRQSACDLVHAMAGWASSAAMLWNNSSSCAKCSRKMAARLWRM